MERVFNSLADLEDFRKQFDAPIKPSTERIADGLMFSARSQDLGGQCFTNVYSISSNAPPHLAFPRGLTTSRQLLQSDNGFRAATSGGFFFLSDDDLTPACSSLNLAIDSNGQVLSLPIADQRETLIVERDRIYTQKLGASGILLVNGHELTWSSSADNDTDITIFGNGNAAITHVKDNTTGNRRVVDTKSNFTPSEIPDGFIDIGLSSATDAHMVETRRAKGNLEILSCNVVARLPEKFIKPNDNKVVIKEVGGVAVDRIQQAITVGPDIFTQDFASHPINFDRSLGADKPPFIGRPIAQNMIFQTEDGRIHTQIFDGRPGSEIFPGITPGEARDITLGKFVVVWGCFLDVGQTANLSTANNNKVQTFGNRHYTKWNYPNHGQFTWSEDSAARPAANFLTF